MIYVLSKGLFMFVGVVVLYFVINRKPKKSNELIKSIKQTLKENYQ